MKKVFCNLIFHTIFINTFSATFVGVSVSEVQKKRNPTQKKKNASIKKNHNPLPDYEAQLKEKGFINQIQRNQNVCFTSI